MSTRSYLSIGDVLSLLRAEFPDVTISKIRFLESQGLVNPERSPSGYRKFYEGDVERLRWVLRQQREHFLPLKVIRDRLAGNEADSPELVESVNGSPSGAAAPVPALARVGTSPGAVARDRDQRAAPRSLPPVPGDASTSQVGPGSDAGTMATPPIKPSPATVTPSIFAKSTPTPPGTPPSAAAGTGDATSQGTSPTAPSRPSASSGPVVGSEAERRAQPVPASAGGGGTARPERPLRPERAAPSAPSGASTPITPTRPPHESEPEVGGGSTAVSGASLTMDELCAASGLSATEIGSLEGFGLIESMVVAGAVYYDEEALIVAKLAAEFRRYGIEPRHLRLYRNAVDREVGLVEQIVTPLLRQRNPEARQRAVDASADVVKLGQSLRSSLLRRELRRQFGP
jgi:DNA-binding transcriptional MerR regulator